MFRWGVSEELVDANVFRSIEAVAGLRKGRSPAPEGRKILPVSNSDIASTLPHLPTIIASIISLRRKI